MPVKRDRIAEFSVEVEPCDIEPSKEIPGGTGHQRAGSHDAKQDQHRRRNSGGSDFRTSTGASGHRQTETERQTNPPRGCYAPGERQKRWRRRGDESRMKDREILEADAHRDLVVDDAIAYRRKDTQAHDLQELHERIEPPNGSRLSCGRSDRKASCHLSIVRTRQRTTPRSP